jgi:hypothetical protein
MAICPRGVGVRPGPLAPRGKGPPEKFCLYLLLLLQQLLLQVLLFYLLYAIMRKLLCNYCWSASPQLPNSPPPLLPTAAAAATITPLKRHV